MTGGLNLFNILKIRYLKCFSYLYKIICTPHFALFYPVFWPR